MVVLAVAGAAVAAVGRGRGGTDREEGEPVSPTTERITRDQIEAKFRELTGDVGTEVDSARPKIVTGALAAGVVVLAVVFLLGRRAGKRKSTVVEVRRI